MRSPALLNEFLAVLRQRLQANSATMLLHTEPPEQQSLLLIHDGADDVVAELADEAAAWQLVTRQAQLDETAGSVEPIVVFASATEDATLVRIAFDKILARPRGERRAVNERRSQPDVDTAPSTDGAIWLGLSGCPYSDAFVAALRRHSSATAADTQSDWYAVLTRLALSLAWSVYHLTGSLQDPVSQLPGRMEFQVFLKRAIAASRQNGQALSLLFVNPDDFTMINHRYGRAHGDLAVREIADALAGCVRQTDGVFRYGGAVFGVVLPATDLAQCKAAAEKIRRMLVQRKYVEDSESLTFSMGAAIANPDDLSDRQIEAADMLRNADVALNRAKLSGGSRFIANSIADGIDNVSILNPLSGIFTADTEKDYRNMLLLWETVGLVSANPEPTAMARALTDRLALGFQPDRLALYDIGEDQRLVPMASNVRDDSAVDGRTSSRPFNLDQRRHDLVLRALQSKQVERLRAENAAGRLEYTAYAVPLIARNEPIACLYLDGRGRRLELDSSDVIFLNALASQIAVALDRARLAAGWIREKDRESRQLREELQELRQSLTQSSMIFESEEMRAVMDTLERVAPTDATVLITGESGTGKEMLAQSIHEFSHRSEKPFVVFDCGAVTHSLLEAELFGHVKGAFTGAENASEGRIAQADGGTLFLDEIGELPLTVQAKLLRFVQEKEFAAVGGAQHRKVDVRIVAATNRKLQDEVAAGRFRADLYYRLQVISLQAVPLRHRRADILPLADHFLNKFADDGKRLSEAAKRKLHEYAWPGNVRELQHCMLRAALTTDGEVIDDRHIELLPESPTQPGAASDAAAEAAAFVQRAPHEALAQGAPAAEPGFEPAADDADPWRPLRTELLRQIQSAIDQNRSRPVPIGRWLTEDLVMAASEVSDQVVRRAARLVGVPESTFRRHFQKASADVEAGLATRTHSWDNVRPLLEELVRRARDDENDHGDDLIERARVLLLDDVEREAQGRISTGAALMGVTAPTYKRWLKPRAEP